MLFYIELCKRQNYDLQMQKNNILFNSSKKSLKILKE